MKNDKTTAITDNACIGCNSDELLKKYATSDMRSGKDKARIEAFVEAEMARKGNTNLDSYAKANLMRSPRNKT